MKAISSSQAVRAAGTPAPGSMGASAERRAREMYARVAAAWATDLLVLRRGGRSLPGFWKERRLMVTPSFGWEHKRGEAA